MSTTEKEKKPSLTGQRIKTRKRDEKEKYDPTTFRDTIVAGLRETIDEKTIDLEKASQFLIKQGSLLDFRRYAEALFDVLLTGGLLAPGGTVLYYKDGEAADAVYCVFSTEMTDGIEPMRKLVDALFARIIRQYKYLEKSLDDEMKKVLQFMKGFTDEQRDRLTVATYLLINAGLCSPACLVSITNEHVVKDGTSLSFARKLFMTWLQEKDFNSLISTLKKAEIDNRLLEMFPINKRSLEAFQEYFKDPELKPVVDFQRNQFIRISTKELKAKLKKRIQDGGESDEIICCCKEYNLPDEDILQIIWTIIMKAVEWNKKEDLLADQALRHIRQYVACLKAYTHNGEEFNLASEQKLLMLVQDHCYDNMNFMKVFSKIVLLLYKGDVLSEESILQWHQSGTSGKQSSKGISVFLTQMDKMIEWLKHAEEESSEEDCDDEEEN